MDKVRVTKKGLNAFIKHNIINNRRWTLRALIVIYNGQNEDEKRFSSCTKRNNIGFNKIDAPRLTIIAERYLRNKVISDVDFRTARRCLPKYWEQILNASDRTQMEHQYRKYIISQENLIETF